MLNKNLNIIAVDSVFKGNFFLNGSIRIDGVFEGEIKADQDIIISSTGNVKSDLNAHRVIVSGELTGNIKAIESVRITSTGRVNGNITSPNLKIEDGAITLGKVSINDTSTT